MAGRQSEGVAKAVADYRARSRLFHRMAYDKPFLLDTEKKLEWARLIGGNNWRLGDQVPFRPKRPTKMQERRVRELVVKLHNIHRTTLWRALRQGKPRRKNATA